MSPYSDPKKQAAYQTAWLRKKRASNPKAKEADQHTEHTETNLSNSNLMNREILKPPMEVRLRKAEDLIDVLEAAMSELLSSDAEVVVKARAIAYLIEKAGKLIEITDLAQKVAHLQAKVDGDAEDSKNWKDASY